MGKLASLRLELSNMPKATETAWNALARRANALKIPFSELVKQVSDYGKTYVNSSGNVVAATNSVDMRLMPLIKAFKDTNESDAFLGILEDMKPLEDGITRAEKVASKLFDRVDIKSLDTKDTSIGGVSSKSIKEITTALEAYDESRAQMVRNISELEIKTSKTTKEGILNDYDEREQAAQYLFMADRKSTRLNSSHRL